MKRIPKAPLKIGTESPVEVFAPGEYIPKQFGGQPLGGKQDQVLTKITDSDFDSGWKTLPSAPVLPDLFFDAGLDISTGRHPDIESVLKFGRKVNVNFGTMPQDVWDTQGVYMGFPAINEPVEFEAFSSNPDDKGELAIQYLENWQSTDYRVARFNLNGTNIVSSGISGVRMHTARYNDSTSNGYNKGEITVRHKDISANVFCRMPAIRAQTACAAITVPFGHKGYITRLWARAYGSDVTQIEAGLWIRDFGESPRVRRPITFSQREPFEERPFGRIEILQGGDIAVRLFNAIVPQPNITAIAGFDIVFVKQ